jgi:hypothetical protein
VGRLRICRGPPGPPTVYASDKGGIPGATSVGHLALSPCALTSTVKGKCALGPFLSILVIECQHKCLNVNLCP